MVSIVENWAVLVGIVLGVMPPEPGDRFATISVEVEQVSRWRDHPMLVRQSPGARVEVRATPGQLGSGDLAGARVTLLVRRGKDPGTLFAAPDWTPDWTPDWRPGAPAADD